MNILTTSIVSNSDMIRNYKSCREKAEHFGKLYILKNNQPDAVLFSITEYERVSAFMEYLESLEEEEVIKISQTLPKEGLRKRYSIDQLKKDIVEIISID
jgi:PHD/YefM family antitoxin component YafN of YafNO toxin-antitoxin module